MEREALGECDDVGLADAIAQLHALQTATMASMLEVIVEFDRREAWKTDGSTSMIDWLVARLGVARRTAADLVGIGDRLAELPVMADVFREGGLSLDQVRAASELADSETDVETADYANGATAAHLEALVRCRRRVTRTDHLERQRQRSFRWWTNQDTGMTHFSGRLPDSDGQRVTNAVTRRAEQAPQHPDTGCYEPLVVRCADALADMAGGDLADDRDPDRASIVVHFNGATGHAELESGVQISRERFEELACECRQQFVFNGVDGRPIGVGRMTRHAPPWLERLVRRRDRHCQFPGCDRTRWLHIHHTEPWAAGGPTDLDKLRLLCTFHHRYVHIQDAPVVPKVKPPAKLRPEIRNRVFSC